MMNQAIAAVCTVLDAEFGLPVYTEPVAQGLSLPCFIVTAEKYNERKEIGNRYQVGFSVEVLYLPSATERRRFEALEVGRRLTELFRFLQLDGAPVHCFRRSFNFKLLTRGFNRGFETSDEVLKFTFEIKMFVIKTDEDCEAVDKMEHCRIRITERNSHGTN